MGDTDRACSKANDFLEKGPAIVQLRIFRRLHASLNLQLPLLTHASQARLSKDLVWLASSERFGEHDGHRSTYECQSRVRLWFRLGKAHWRPQRSSTGFEVRAGKCPAYDLTKPLCIWRFAKCASERFPVDLLCARRTIQLLLIFVQTGSAASPCDKLRSAAGTCMFGRQ